MVNGRLRAAVRFDEVCELVAVYNLGTKGQVTVGLGGSGAMFSIREWLPPVTSEQMVGSWVNYALLGDRANLKAGITYEIGVRVWVQASHSMLMAFKWLLQRFPRLSTRHGR